MFTRAFTEPRSTLPEGTRGRHISGSTTRALLSLLVMLSVVIAVALALMPRYVAPATAQTEVFSGARAMVHLPVVSAQPHPAGTPEQALVRDYLLAQLSALGLQPEVQRAGGVENVVARLPGTASTGAVVVLAHYDSVSARRR
jgi:hypothetical protein